jgi:hypothetical protein
MTSDDFAPEEFERVHTILQQLAEIASEVDQSEVDIPFWIGFAFGLLMQRFDGIDLHAARLLERYAELVDTATAERN